MTQQPGYLWQIHRVWRQISAPQSTTSRWPWAVLLAETGVQPQLLPSGEGCLSVDEQCGRAGLLACCVCPACKQNTWLPTSTRTASGNWTDTKSDSAGMRGHVCWWCGVSAQGHLNDMLLKFNNWLTVAALKHLRNSAVLQLSQCS